MTETIEQRSDEWFAARCGSLGASQIANALAKTKNGWGASRANLRAQLVIERLTGIQEDGFKSSAMQWGIDNEDGARTAYEAATGEFVTEVGLYKHPAIQGTHASPDGLVGDDGLIEIKCPTSATHIETLKGGEIPLKYRYQMQWQMACTDRQWCDFVSYDPRMPEYLQLSIERVKRDDELVKWLSAEISIFLSEVDEDIAVLEKIGAKNETD